MSLDIVMRNPALAGSNLSVRLFDSGPTVPVDPVNFELRLSRGPTELGVNRNLELTISRMTFDLARAEGE